MELFWYLSLLFSLLQTARTANQERRRATTTVRETDTRAYVCMDVGMMYVCMDGRVRVSDM